MLLLIAAVALTATPAELAMQSAEKEIAAHADYAPGYAHLAIAYTRRTRETGDTSLLDRAEASTQKALALAPDNFEALKAAVFVMLGRHEWSRALEHAKELNKQTPDDVAIYGYMAEAQMALGDFQGAVENTEWMLRLRPGNTAALIRTGRLRELYGDRTGALEAMQGALDTTPFGDTEERAWILVQIARESRESGDTKRAEAALKEALGIFPDYYLAQRELGDRQR